MKRTHIQGLLLGGLAAACLLVALLLARPSPVPSRVPWHPGKGGASPTDTGGHPGSLPTSSSST